MAPIPDESRSLVGLLRPIPLDISMVALAVEQGEGDVCAIVINLPIYLGAAARCGAR